MPSNPSMTVVRLASSGTPYALRICTMYGRMAKMPQNCMMKHWNAIKMNGFRVRLRPTSFNFSHSVGGGCSHLADNFSQFKHELDAALYRCKSANSPDTAAGDTQPRSHCSDFIASSPRAFESNQIGVSGTYFLEAKKIVRSSRLVAGANSVTYKINGDQRAQWNRPTNHCDCTPCHQCSH